MPAENVDPAVDRALSETTTSIQRLEALLRSSSAMVADLVIGTNRIQHGLGRRPFHCRVTPTVVSAAFAYALTAGTDDRVAVIEVVGADQPGAGLWFE